MRGPLPSENMSSVRVMELDGGGAGICEPPLACGVHSLLRVSNDLGRAVGLSGGALVCGVREVDVGGVCHGREELDVPTAEVTAEQCRMPGAGCRVPGAGCQVPGVGFK